MSDGLLRNRAGLFGGQSSLLRQWRTFGPDYNDEVLRDSPVGYWPMDETSGSTMADRSGNGRDLTLTNAVAGTRTPAPFDGVSPDFDGNGDFASSSSVTWWSGAAGASLECWFYVDAIVASMPGGINSFMGNLASSSNGALIRADGVSGTSLPLQVYFGSSGGYRTLSATHTISTQRIVHIVATFDSTTVRLYVDGDQVGTGTGGGTATFNMAMRVASSEDGRWLDGTVHHCALYATTLPASRVRAHHSAAWSP
jgi:hypothetical protein